MPSIEASGNTLPAPFRSTQPSVTLKFTSGNTLTSATGFKLTYASLGCRPGYYSVKETSECIQCPAGKYRSNVRSTLCTSCAIGLFQAHPGRTSCTECPSGRVTQNVSSINVAQCDTDAADSNCRPGFVPTSVNATWTAVRILFYLASSLSMLC